jgi:hypothetical protein
LLVSVFCGLGGNGSAWRQRIMLWDQWWRYWFWQVLGAGRWECLKRLAQHF